MVVMRKMFLPKGTTMVDLRNCHKQVHNPPTMVGRIRDREMVLPKATPMGGMPIMGRKIFPDPTPMGDNRNMRGGM